MHLKIKVINEKCEKVLECCMELLMVALRNNHCSNIFDMLDPLVSDNQCHMHALLLLNVLRKSYKIEDYSYDVERLNDVDIEILSNAVLLSHFKAATIDEFNFVVREVSLDNFCCYFDTKKAEKRFIAKIKAKLNADSARFLKSLADDEVKCIFEACAAGRSYSGHRLQLLPHYAAMFPILTYLKERNLPILIVLQRIERKTVQSGLKHRLHSTEVMIFKHENGKYRLCDEVTDVEKMQPTIAFSCYSCIGYAPSDGNYLSKYRQYIENSTFPSRMFFEDCDITNLLMMSASDYQFPNSSNIVIPKGCDNGQTYAEMIYRNNSVNPVVPNCQIESKFDSHSTNIYGKYIGHSKLQLACNSSDCTQYCKVVDGAIKRIEKNVFFAIVHVYISNYERERCNRICSQHFLDQTETYDDIDKERKTLDVLRTLGFGVNKS